MKRSKVLTLLTALLLALTLFAGCAANTTDNSTEASSGTSADLTPITVCLDWTPNTNHTGLFVADTLGYYEQAGLDVTLVQPPENGAVEACAAGQAQFAVDFQDTLAAAFTSDTPMDITVVAALVQHNTSGIMSAKGSGMQSPKGLENHTYLTWDSPIELAILENLVTADGGDWSKVTRIPNTVTDEAQDITANPDHAIWVYYGWSGINAELSGVETDLFMLRDLNETFDYYTPVLIANNSFIKSSPDLVRAFLKATRMGYEYAIANPEDAAKLLIESDTTQSLVGSENLVIESQKYLNEQYIADAPQWGYIDAQRWDAFYTWLYEEGLISKEIPADTSFTNDYLS